MKQVILCDKKERLLEKEWIDEYKILEKQRPRMCQDKLPILCDTGQSSENFQKEPTFSGKL